MLDADLRWHKFCDSAVYVWHQSTLRERLRWIYEGYVVVRICLELPSVPEREYAGGGQPRPLRLQPRGATRGEVSDSFLFYHFTYTVLGTKIFQKRL